MISTSEVRVNVVVDGQLRRTGAQATAEGLRGRAALRSATIRRAGRTSATPANRTTHPLDGCWTKLSSHPPALSETLGGKLLLAPGGKRCTIPARFRQLLDSPVQAYSHEPTKCQDSSLDGPSQRRTCAGIASDTSDSAAACLASRSGFTSIGVGSRTSWLPRVSRIWPAAATRPWWRTVSRCSSRPGFAAVPRCCGILFRHTPGVTAYYEPLHPTLQLPAAHACRVR